MWRFSGLPIGVLVFALGVMGCATGGGETAAKDSCRIRDCGPTFGGPELPPDEEEDTDPFPADDVGVDAGSSDVVEDVLSDVGDSKPISDAPSDVASLDVGTDTAEVGPSCVIAPGRVCSTIPQCGCATTTNCDVTSLSGATSCVASGIKRLHEACKNIGDCGKGLTCLGDVCVPFCRDTADCGVVKSPVCLQATTYDDVTKKSTDIAGYKACVGQCDLRDPSAVCGVGVGCGVFDFDKGITGCAQAGKSTAHAGCKTNPKTCAPGYICYAGDCLKWCRVGFPGDCTSPTYKTCFPFSDPLLISAVQYGVCDA